MWQVAERAGVSKSTVSNVLNNPRVVAPETRRRVEEAMAAVGYIRSSAARQLRGVRSPVVGCVLLDSTNPFFAELSRGVEDRLVEEGCLILVCNTDLSSDKEARYLRMLREQGVRGMVVSPSGTGIDHLVQISRSGTPVVLVDHPQDDPVLCGVGVDHVTGGALIARHLVDLGHRRITLVTGVVEAPPLRQRIRGLRQGVRRAGLDPEEHLAQVPIPLPVDRAAVDTVLDAVLDRAQPPTAIVCLNDITAFAILEGLGLRGIRVPRDVSVVGYDDLFLARLVAPSLTTVRQPVHRIGHTAAQLLLNEAEPGHEHRQVVVEPELMARESTAPPSRG